ncbi:MAG: hypothetical protein ACE5FZ_02625 [Nitrospiria bacterium]
MMSRSANVVILARSILKVVAVLEFQMRRMIKKEGFRLGKKLVLAPGSRRRVK